MASEPFVVNLLVSTTAGICEIIPVMGLARQSPKINNLFEWSLDTHPETRATSTKPPRHFEMVATTKSVLYDQFLANCCTSSAATKTLS